MVKCATCKKSFPSIAVFKLHLPSHGGCRFLCGEDNCGRSFSACLMLIRHLRREHQCQDEVSQNYLEPKISDENCSSDNCDVSEIDSGFIDNDESMDYVSPDVSAEDFRECYEKSVEVLVAKLYQNPSIPRNFVQTIIDDLDLFLNGGFFEILQLKVSNALSVSQAPASSVSDIMAIFDVMKDPFKGLQTDYKRVQFFEANKFYVPPKEFVISPSRPKPFKTSAGVVVKMVKTTGQFVPFRKVLQNLFELPGALRSTLDYVEFLNNASKESICNVIQGALWKCKRSIFPDDVIVFPLDFYFDHVEANAALGPHSGSLGVGCVIIPVLPPACKSKLENILLALLINSDDRKSITPGKVSYNAEVFKPVIDEFNYLTKKGIVCNTSDMGQKHVYFILNRVTADNLGLHGVLGFAEGFTANFPCIICRAPKESVQIMTEEDPNLLRDPINYAEDVMKNNVSETGVKELCAFNRVKSCHVVNNMSVDFMHDGPEGACHYVLIPVLKHCIDAKYFSLSTLNSRLYFFDFGPTDSSNKPVPIKDDFHKNSKLKGTAREILSLVRFLGVIIGDLVPENDPFWRLYLLHKDIIEICLAKELPYSLIGTFNVLVKDHHELFLRLVDRLLPPKLHYFLHYLRVMKESGPPSHFSSFRGEAKHRDLTQYARAITSRRNLPLSCATKHQLGMCFRFVSQSPLLPEMICGPGEVIDIHDHEHYSNIKSKLPVPLSSVRRVNWVDVQGTNYKLSMVLVYGVSESCKFKFGKILDIFIHDNKALFVCQRLTNVGFNDHVGGHRIVYSKYYICVFHDDLYDPFPLYDFSMSSGERYVVLKHYL